MRGGNSTSRPRPATALGSSQYHRVWRGGGRGEKRLRQHSKTGATNGRSRNSSQRHVQSSGSHTCLWRSSTSLRTSAMYSSALSSSTSRLDRSCGHVFRVHVETKSSERIRMSPNHAAQAQESRFLRENEDLKKLKRYIYIYMPSANPPTHQGKTLTSPAESLAPGLQRTTQHNSTPKALRQVKIVLRSTQQETQTYPR